MLLEVTFFLLLLTLHEISLYFTLITQNLSSLPPSLPLSLSLSLREAVNLGDAASSLSASSVIGKVLSGRGRDRGGMEGSGRRETATRDVGVWLSLHITVDDVRASHVRPSAALSSVRLSVLRARRSIVHQIMNVSFPPSLSLLVVISHACISM